MSRHERLVVGTVGVLLGSGVGLIGSLGARIVMARALGPSALGVLSFGIALVSSLGLAVSTGLLSATARRVAERLHAMGPGGGGPTARTALVAATAIGTGTAVAVLLFRAQLARLLDQPELATVMGVLAPVALGLAVGSTVWGLSQGYDEIRGRAIIRDAGGGVLRLAGVAVAALLSGTVTGVAAGWVSGCLLAELAFLAHGFRRGWLSGGAERWDSALLGTLPPYVGQSVLRQVRQWSDLLVLGIVCAPATVGLYSVARGLIQLPNMVWLSAMHRFLPQATRAAATDDRDELGLILTATRRLVFALMWPVLAVSLVTPEPLLRILFGDAFGAADEILRVLAATFMVRAIGGYLEPLLIAANRAATVFRISAATFGITTPVMVWAAVSFGGLGVAITLLAGQVLATACFIRAARRQTGVRVQLGGFLRWSTVVCAPALACGVLLSLTNVPDVAEAALVLVAATPPTVRELLPHRRQALLSLLGGERGPATKREAAGSGPANG